MHRNLATGGEPRVAVTYITHTTHGTVKTKQNASASEDRRPKRRYMPTHPRTELQLINELRASGLKRVSKFSELSDSPKPIKHFIVLSKQSTPTKTARNGLLQVRVRLRVRVRVRVRV